MDVFFRTFLPATAEAALPIPTVSRHMPIFRRCVDAADATLFITRCLRPDRPLLGEHLLLLTRQRLVVTHETRLLRRARLYLNTALQELNNVTWTPDPRMAAVELAATANDGLRERFWMKLGHPSRVWRLDALLSHAFRPARQPRPPAAGDPPAEPLPADTPVPQSRPAPAPQAA